MALKIPIITMEYDNRVLKYTPTVVRRTNGINFSGGAEILYNNSKELWDFFVSIATPNTSKYIKLVESNKYLEIQWVNSHFGDSPIGAKHSYNLHYCDINKVRKYGGGSIDFFPTYPYLNTYASPLTQLTWGVLEDGTPCNIYANKSYKSTIASQYFINLGGKPLYDYSYSLGTVPKNFAWISGDDSANNGCGKWVIDNTLKQYLFGNSTQYDYPNYPFNPSTSGGGDGNGDKTTDDILIPSLPSNTITASNLLKIYKMQPSTLSSLSDFLWSDNLFDDLKQILGNPIDSIVSLKILYCDVLVSSSENIILGNIDTGISTGRVNLQYLYLDCGTIQIDEYFGNALDYNPYTTAEVFLPFCGTIPLDIDDIMKANVNIEYIIDVLSGSCVAHVKVQKNVDNTELNSILYTASGNLSVDIPISANNSIGLTTALVGAVANSVFSTSSGSPIGEISSALSVSAMKQRVSKNNNLGSNFGALSIKKPYITIHRPIQSVAEDYSKFVGFPLNVNKKLKDVNGFTTVDSAILNFNALTEEKEMIIDLLQSGVFV